MFSRLSFPRHCRGLLVAMALVAGATTLSAIPAFPGAEGFGANATGGRGGSVYLVTNLNDSGPGSFRDAVSAPNRTVVFTVGGVIRINSVVAVKNNITIAGQTAPGGGITIYGNRVSFSDAHNTICRYIRFRQGINGDSGTDAVGIASGHDMIFDHVSASWGRDETFSVSGGGIANITLQDCIIGQGLLTHSAGGLIQPGGGLSIFRTLYIDNYMRNPKIKGINDYRNNVVYNWGSGGGYIPAGDSAGDSFANMIGNYFIGGFNSGVGDSPFKSGNQNYRLFHTNNREDLNLNGVLDGTPVTNASFPTLQLVGEPFDYPAPRIELTPEQAVQHIATYAGASHRRDSVDTNMIAELLSYGIEGRHIYNESEVGGVGEVAGAPTAVLDTDADGMPDWWEEAAGTNPLVADNNGDIDGDGYTNLENYINSLVVAGVPQLTLDSISPDTGASATDGITTARNLVLRGTAAPGATVQVSRIDTGVIGTAVADASGDWVFDYSGTTLADRHYGFVAAVAASDGLSLPTPVRIVKVDTTPPAAPVLTGLVTLPDYAFNGTAEIFATVSVLLEGVGEVGVAVADGAGKWTAPYTGAPLAPGEYHFTAIATDLAGNTSTSSAVYVVDTTLASPTFTAIDQDTGVSSTDLITRDTTLNLSGTGPANSLITVTRTDVGVVGTTTANASGVWTFNYTGTTLASGQYTFTAVASVGGSSSPASPPFVVTVDTVAPTIQSIVRLDPTTPATTSSTLVYRVTFVEPVVNVDIADFTLTRSAGVTGTIASLVQVSGDVYDVTVQDASGDGTIRLDRGANSSIQDLAGNAGSSGTYTGGQSYTLRFVGSGVWALSESGGVWSDPASWEGGVIADGAGATADFSARDLDEDAVAHLDSPRTIGRLVLGDADYLSPASWTLDDHGNPANVLTLAGGTPTIQVNGATSASGDTVDVPAANAYPSTLDLELAGDAGLTKTGVGTLQFVRPVSLTGPLTITKGIVQVAEGGSFTPSSVSIATSQQLRITGGYFSTPGNVTWTSGTGTGIIVSAGEAHFQRILPSNTRNSFVHVTGGVFTATEIDFPRSGDSENQAIAAGVHISGGDATVGLLGLGTANSWGALTVSGGRLTVTDTINNGYQVTSARGGVITVTGGELNVPNTDPGKGLIMGRNPGSNPNNVSKLIINGGVVNAGRITLGYDATSSAGSSTVALNNGELSLGAGGIVKNGAAGLASSLTLTSGVLGAVDDWSTTHPLLLAGSPATFAIRAAAADGTPHMIVLTGQLRDAAGVAGGFAKTGAGRLVLGGANDFTGDVVVQHGELSVSGSLGAGGEVSLNAGTLSGTGAIAKPIVLNSGAAVSPGNDSVDTLTADSLVWNGGGTLVFDLGATSSDRLSLDGALAKGTSGAFTFAFSPIKPLIVGTTYTLVDFGSTDFSATDFSATGLGYAKGVFSVSANAVHFTLTSDGSGALAYQAWADAHGLPANAAGPADDADGDGVPNLLEFALAQNPLAFGGVKPVMVTHDEAGELYPAMRFVRRIDRGDVTVDVHVSTGLDFADSLGAIEVSATDRGDGTELVVVRSAVPLSAEPRQFLRVEASLP